MRDLQPSYGCFYTESIEFIRKIIPWIPISRASPCPDSLKALQAGRASALLIDRLFRGGYKRFAMLPRTLLPCLIIGLASFGGFIGETSAQQTDSNSCVLPVSPASISGSLETAPSELAIKIHWGKVRAQAQVSAVPGSRRIVVVLDNSKFTQDRAWEVQASLAERFFEQARPIDLLALYVISDQSETIDFSQSRQAKVARLKELSKSRPPHKQEKRRIYDALDASLRLFGQPQFADSILYLGGGIDHESSVSLGKAVQALANGGVRVFGVLLKGLYQGKAGAPIQYLPSNETAIDLMDLAQQSGGAFEYQETTDPQKEFDPTPENLQLVWQKLVRSYWRVILTYKLDLSAFADRNSANLQLAIESQSRDDHDIPALLYPHRKLSCSLRRL